VAGGAIDDGAVGHILSIVNKDGPDLHEDEEAQVGELLQREEEGEDVVGGTLEEAVDGVEGDGGVGRGHDPLVVRLVQGLVDGRVVQAAVDEVDEGVGKEDEEGELQEVVPHAGPGIKGVVELGVAPDLGEEEGDGEDGHAGHAERGLADLHADLVLEELGVFEGGLIEDEDVGDGGDDEVNNGSAEPAGGHIRP